MNIAENLESFLEFLLYLYVLHFIICTLHSYSYIIRGKKEWRYLVEIMKMIILKNKKKIDEY